MGTLSASLRFEDNDSGIVLLRKDGSLLHANAAARNMARQEDGFRIAPTGITADHPPDNAMLQKLIGHSLAKAEAGPVLRITRQSGRDDFLVMASPIPAESHVFSALRPALCLLITDPAARLSAPIAGLRKLFGLTQAQAKVAAALVSGLQVEEAAAELGISPYTVRFHVAAVLKKTGTTRQHDLVRLLTSIPWQTLTRIQAD